MYGSHRMHDSGTGAAMRVAVDPPVAYSGDAVFDTPILLTTSLRPCRLASRLSSQGFQLGEFNIPMVRKRNRDSSGLPYLPCLVSIASVSTTAFELFGADGASVDMSTLAVCV